MGNLRKFYLLVPLVALALGLLGTRSPETVLAFTDPVARTLNSREWPPNQWSFKLIARVLGFRIEAYQDTGDFDLEEVLSGLTVEPAALLFSPYNIISVEELSTPTDIPLIVAGGPPPAWAEEGDGIGAVVPHRLEALAECGRLAARIAVFRSQPAILLFRTDTPEREQEYETFVLAFLDEAGPAGADLMIQLEVGAPVSIPEDFEEQSRNAALGVFLAGPANIEAVMASADSQLPFITEHIWNSNAWRNRLVASIEDSPREMTLSLLKLLASGGIHEVYFYPQRMVINKKWFDVHNMPNL